MTTIITILILIMSMQNPTMYAGGRLHLRSSSILVQRSVGVVGGGGQRVAGVQGGQHLLGYRSRLPGRVGRHKAQKRLLHFALSTPRSLHT